MSLASLYRHKSKHVPVTLAKAEVARQMARATALAAWAGQQDGEREGVEEARAVALTSQLHTIFGKVALLFDACDRYLRDPDAPDQYDVGPRAGDVSIVYEEPGPRGRPIQKKALLSILLARLEDESDIAVKVVEIRHDDPRRLLVRAADSLRSNLELMARIIGTIDQQPTVSLSANPEWLTMRLALLAAVERHPEARQALAEALLTVERQ